MLPTDEYVVKNSSYVDDDSRWPFRSEVSSAAEDFRELFRELASVSCPRERFGCRSADEPPVVFAGPLDEQVWVESRRVVEPDGVEAACIATRTRALERFGDADLRAKAMIRERFIGRRDFLSR